MKTPPLTLTLLMLLTSGCGSRAVVRMQAGELAEGRLIHPRAYAEYARGALRAADAEFAQAIAHYQAAVAADPDGPEPRIRLAHASCMAGRSEAAQAQFEQAAELGGAYALNRRLFAECALFERRFEDAAHAAEEALVGQPESIETLLILAEARYHTAGYEAARDLLLPALLAPIHSTRARTRIEPWAKEANDQTVLRLLRRSATGAFEVDNPKVPRAAVPAPGPSEWDMIVADLQRGRLPAARASQRASLSRADLSLWAIALGQSALARELALGVLAADPTNGEALVALWLADPEALIKLPQPVSRPLSSFAKALVLRQLSLHGVGRHDPEDPLAAELARRKAAAAPAAAAPAAATSQAD